LIPANFLAKKFMVWVFFCNFDFIEGTFARKYPNKFDYIEFYHDSIKKKTFFSIFAAPKFGILLT